MKISEMIHLIRNGIDPTTGEVFDQTDFTNDTELRKEVIKLVATLFNKTHIDKEDSLNKLNRNSNLIFEELKEWRRNTANDAGIPAFVVFNDKELWNISEGDVCEKDDLLLVKGVSYEKFKLYGDDLFDIIKEHIRKDEKA